MHGRRIHQQMFKLYIVVFFMHFNDSAPPKTHRGQHICLIHRAEHFAPPLRRAKGDIGHLLHLASAVAHRIVRFVASALLLPRAKVNAADELAHEQYIDVLQQLRPQWGLLKERGIGLHRAQVGEQAEMLAKLQQAALRLYACRWVGPFGSADSAEQDGVSRLAEGDCLGRQGIARFVDRKAADQPFNKGELMAMLGGDVRQQISRLPYHFGPDAVTGQYRYRRFHG